MPLPIFHHRPNSAINAKNFQPANSAATFAEVNKMEPAEAVDPRIGDEAAKTKKRGFARRMGTAIGDYAHRLAMDYTTVAKDVVRDSRQQPFKALAISGALFGLVYAVRSNPDERALRSRLAQLRQQMIMIPTAIHSRQADSTLEHYTNLLNQGRMDLMDFWFFTLLVEKRFCKKSNFHAAMEPTIRHWPWTEIRQNSFDIGAFGRFWALESDVNEEEFPPVEAKTAVIGGK